MNSITYLERLFKIFEGMQVLNFGRQSCNIDHNFLVLDGE